MRTLLILALLVTTPFAHAADEVTNFNSSVTQFAASGKFEMSALLGRKLVDSKCKVPEHMNGRLQVHSISTKSCVTHFDSEPFYCSGTAVVQRTSINFSDVSEDPIDWPEDELKERTVFAMSLRSNSSSRDFPYFSRNGGNIRNGLVDESGQPYNLITLSKRSLMYGRLLHEIDARSTSFRVGSAERLEKIRLIFADRQNQCGSAPAYSSERITYYWSPRSLDEMTFDWTFPLNESFRCRDPLVHGKLLDGRWRKREFDSWHMVTVHADEPKDIASPMNVSIKIAGSGAPPVSLQFERPALKIICSVPEYIIWKQGRGGLQVAEFVVGDTFACRNARIKGDLAGNMDRHSSYQSEDFEGHSLVHFSGSDSGSNLSVYVNDQVLSAANVPVRLTANSLRVKCDV
ncbi:hypothetical protein [Pyruvatibacter sp.]